MPFRSDDESLREQTRRLEETAAELREEKADLERQIGQQRAGPRWLAGLVGIIALAGFVGCAAGAAASAAEAARIGEQHDREQGEALEAQRARQVACDTARDHVSAELQICMKALATESPFIEKVLSGRDECPCQAGDPLCECPFSRSAAAAKLAAAQEPISGCVPPRPALPSIHARITFAPPGRAESVVIDSGAEQLTDAERTCIRRALEGVKVPRFEGGPVTVGKTYSLVRP